MSAQAVNLWSNPEHAREYLDRRATDSWRAAAYGHLLDIVPPAPRRVLDLGCGDGEVIGRVAAARPGVVGVACDFSPEMLGRVRQRFADSTDVTVVEHDLDDPFPAEWGTFDLVVSAFAIHHVVDGHEHPTGEQRTGSAHGKYQCDAHRDEQDAGRLDDVVHIVERSGHLDGVGPAAHVDGSGEHPHRLVAEVAERFEPLLSFAQPGEELGGAGQAGGAQVGAPGDHAPLEIDAVVEFEELAEKNEDAPTAIALLD